MRMRSVVIWSLVALFSILATADGSSRIVETDELLWFLDRPIGWGDFQGKPPVHAESTGQAAEIHTAIRWHLELVIEYDCQQYLWKAIVNRGSLVATNTMDPTLSWVVPGRRTNTALRHEQGHFDLNEVYRRKLQKALPALAAEGDTAESARHALQGLIDKTSEETLNQLAETEERYDEETCHGTDLQGQAAWNQAIDAWLGDPDLAP